MAKFTPAQDGDDAEVPETPPPAPAPASGRLAPDASATARSFVVQLTSSAEQSPGAFCGRVQHLATSDGGNFASPEALISIIRRVLSRTERDRRGT